MANEPLDGTITVRELITKLLSYRMDATVQLGVDREYGARRDNGPVLNGILGRTNDERPTLSAREIEVLQLSSDGLSDKQVADRLFISIRTVRCHLDNIREKIGVDTTHKAYIEAIKNGDVLCPCRFTHEDT
jgi:DNA-binding CsgD family transcriptional regulator